MIYLLQNFMHMVYRLSDLKRRKQGVKINGTESVFQILLSGIPQMFYIGPILFNIFINYLFSFI